MRDFGLADIFQLIGIQRKTCVLVLKHGDTQVVVSFLSGGVVSAGSSDQALEERLGSVLVKSGKITDRQLSDALKVQKSTLMRLGRVLVEQRAISMEELREALKIQVTQTVHRLFRWRDGEYHFSQEETIDYDPEHFTPIAAENILMEGARMIDEWPIIERRIRNFEMILRRKSEASPGSVAPVSVYETDLDFGLMDAGSEKPDDERVRLARDEGVVYQLVDGRSTVQNIIDRSPLGEFDTCRILSELMGRDLVEEGLGAAVAPGASPARSRRRALLPRAGLFLMPVVAVVSLVYSLKSPLSPFGGAGGGDPFGIDRIRVHLSQARLGRIDQALRLFHLDHQALPISLEALVQEGFLETEDLLDPWGKPYEFRIHPSGYAIRGYSPPGALRSAVSLETQFMAAQRLAVEGGTLESVAKPEPWP